MILHSENQSPLGNLNYLKHKKLESLLYKLF